MQTVQAKVSYRIPVVGGFTDYSHYYRSCGAQSICFTINKYLLVSIEENKQGGLDISSRGDLPWGIGLGSSGAFHSALIMALAKFRRRRLSKITTAKLAYELETGIDRYATGRQDSVSCLFRGFFQITYRRNDSITVDQIVVPAIWRKKLSDRLMLFDTGIRRRACDSIKDILSRKNRPLLDEIARLPILLTRAWKVGNLDFLGTALNLQEEYRSRLSPTCKSTRTDRLLRIARQYGGGARLTGAGIGCLLCYCPEEKKKQLSEELNIPEIPVSIVW